MIPLFLDLRGRRVVVFGGGPVGRRKAEHFLPEADVCIITRSREPSLQDFAGEVIEADAFDILPQMMAGADLIVAATDDPALNELILQEAARLGIFCNGADAVGTFLIPSTVHRDGLEVAISTLGRAPALARRLRLQLEEAIGAEHEMMVRILEEAKAAAKQRLSTQAEREAALRLIVADEEIWALLPHCEEAARALALRKVMEHG